MNIDVSPDGAKLIFDLLGDIYQLPIDGGQAMPLTSGRAWDQAPRFSPDGKHIYFVSDREGYKNIWRLTLADSSIKQVTTRSDSHILGGPNWSQDGCHLLVGVGDAYTLNSEVTLHSIDPYSGRMTAIDAPARPWIDMGTFKVHRSRIKVFSGVESVDSKVYFSQGQEDEHNHQIVLMYEFDRNTKNRTALTPSGAPYSDYKPQLSHDGRLLAYFRQYNDRRTEIRIRYRTTGQDEGLIELSNSDDATYSESDDSRPNYAFTPDDRNLVYWHAGKIHRVNLADKSSELIPFRVNINREVWERAQPAVQHIHDTGEAEIIRWPSVSNDEQTMAFAAIGYVWIMDLATGDLRRLTDAADFEFMPAISPDGRSVAYVNFTESDDKHWSSRLMVAAIDEGVPQQILAAPNETYLLPSWSHDGERIALISEVDNENSVEASFGWTSALSGPFHKVASAPSSSDHRLSSSIFARFVGFDADDSNLMFTFPRTSIETVSKTETVLAIAALDGSNRRTLAIGKSDVGGITPAPNLEHLVLNHNNRTVWLVPFDTSLEGYNVSTASAEARQIISGGGYYVSWNRPNHFTFGFGKNVYRYDLIEGKSESYRVKVVYSKPSAIQPVAFTGARLITMSNVNGTDAVIQSGTIVLEGQRISAVGADRDVSIPIDALVIDAAGKTIIPGLLDTHYHRIGGRDGWFGQFAFKVPNPNFGDQSAIAYGVTTAWEPGGVWNDGAPATVDLQAAGRILGPRWSHSAGGSVGIPWKYQTSYTSVLSAVEQHADLGVAVLKEYSSPTRQQQQWLSAAAYEKSLGIISHIDDFDGLMTRVIDGYTGGEHPYIPMPFFKDVHELLRQTGYIWTPNITISVGSVSAYEDVKYYAWRELFQKRPWELDKLKKIVPANSFYLDIEEQSSVPYETHRVSRVAEQAAEAATKGINISVSAHNMPGSNLHQEMWYLWKGGMPIDEVLRAATIGNAKKLGLHEEVGSLEVGKMADFLVLDENPLDDILNTLSLKYTVQGGVVFDSATAQRVDILSLTQTQAAGVVH